MTSFPLKCGYWNWEVVMNFNGKELVVACVHVCLCVSLCLHSKTIHSILDTVVSHFVYITVNRLSTLLRRKSTLGMSICGASNNVLYNCMEGMCSECLLVQLQVPLSLYPIGWTQSFMYYIVQ